MQVAGELKSVIIAVGRFNPTLGFPELDLNSPNPDNPTVQGLMPPHTQGNDLHF